MHGFGERPMNSKRFSRRTIIAASCAIGAVGVTVTALSALGATGVAEIADDGHASSPDYWSMTFVFLLSSFIGLGVIRRVSRLLHTPLMSLTNAISAIAVVGAILVAGLDSPWPITLLGAIALFASVTNIVSGFLITDRMLRMFKQER